MAFGSGGLSGCCFLLILCSLKVLMLASAVRSEQLKIKSPVISSMPTIKRDEKEYMPVQKCERCNDGKNIEIIATYTDATGIVKIHTVKSRDLSISWVLEKYDDENHAETKSGLDIENSHQQSGSKLQNHDWPSTDQPHRTKAVDGDKLERRKLREERKLKRTEELIHINENVELKMQKEAIERSKEFDTREEYSVWRREYKNRRLDTTLKLMRDQIILAKVYSSIARSNKMRSLSDALNKLIKQSQDAIKEANSDDELEQGALEQAKAMGNALSRAKVELYDCDIVARKLRALVQSTEESVMALKKKSFFLMQFVSWSTPKPHQCLALELTINYSLNKHSSKRLADKKKTENPSLYHYAIFSDNVLSTAVVVNSTVLNAKEPAKHVFHILTDRSHFAAMRMWFIAHPPLSATVQVENIDTFKWLNASYCQVLRQIRSPKMIEFYLKASHPTTLSGWEDQLKFRNPKYLSMLNHLRFYMPELFPKLDKVLFLDDDVVVQKDLTPLWSINMNGMVNGAVETCNGNFHRFDSYLNFSNPKVSQYMDPNGCGWAFGMNIFDLKQWRKRNLTGVYHYWQDMNEDRQLWQLGSLPAGLLTFNNLTYTLDPSWHVLKLGYYPSVNITEIEEAAVIHFNGNFKPWLALGFSQYRGYWSKYVNYNSPYLQRCHIYE